MTAEMGYVHRGKARMSIMEQHLTVVLLQFLRFYHHLVPDRHRVL